MVPHYKHTQVGWLIGGTVILAGTLGGVATGGERVVFWPMLAILGLLLLLFGSLTVSVDDCRLTASFGVGLFRWRIALADVRSHVQVRNSWTYGWGIRLIPRGLLLNVSGLDAVELRMKSGKRYRIGTDEPDALHAAVRKVVGDSQGPSPEDLQDDQRAAKRIGWIVGFGVVGVLCAVGGMMFLQARPPEARVEGNSLAVDSFLYGQKYGLEEVTQVALVQQLPPIRVRTNGFAWGGTLRGNFRLDGLGVGKLFVEKSFPPFLLVRLKETFVIINFKESRKTTDLFENLHARWVSSVVPRGVTPATSLQ